MAKKPTKLKPFEKRDDKNDGNADTPPKEAKVGKMPAFAKGKKVPKGK